MDLKNLKQLLRKTVAEISSPIIVNVYRGRNEFSLEDKISTHVFMLQRAMQTMVADKTEELDDKWRFF